MSIRKIKVGVLLAIINNLHKNDESIAIRTEALPLSETDKLRFVAAAKISCFFSPYYFAKQTSSNSEHFNEILSSLRSDGCLFLPGCWTGSEIALE